MKNLINQSVALSSFLIWAFILVFGCSSRNDFSYNGKYPTWNYLNNYNAESIGDLMIVNSDMVSKRNRIYLTFDTSLNAFLNGYPLSKSNFEKDFKFIYSNPDNLPHLPESPNKAVVFFANLYVSNFDIKPSLELKKKHLEFSELNLIMAKVVQDLQEEHIKNEMGIDFENTDSVQQAVIETKFPLNFATYSAGFEKQREQMNRGIMSKLSDDRNTSNRERNMIRVKINNSNKIFVRDKALIIDLVTDSIKIMIQNPLGIKAYPESPKKAIISLKSEKETDYQAYLELYNALKKAYKELWDEQAFKIFEKKYDELSSMEKKRVKKIIPLMISEAEPDLFSD